jgi:hypothetical protein
VDSAKPACSDQFCRSGHRAIAATVATKKGRFLATARLFDKTGKSRCCKAQIRHETAKRRRLCAECPAWLIYRFCRLQRGTFGNVWRGGNEYTARPTSTAPDAGRLETIGDRLPRFALHLH